MKKMTKETLLQGAIVEYYANSITSTEVLRIAGIQPTETLERIVSESQQGWYALPCGSEGATAKEDKKMDAYLSDVATEILANV